MLLAAFEQHKLPTCDMTKFPTECNQFPNLLLDLPEDTLTFIKGNSCHWPTTGYWSSSIVCLKFPLGQKTFCIDPFRRYHILYHSPALHPHSFGISTVHCPTWISTLTSLFFCTSRIYTEHLLSTIIIKTTIPRTTFDATPSF